MSVLCPEGHRSESADYCDTCGAPIGADASDGAPATATTSAPEVSLLETDEQPLDLSATQTCPFCGGLNVQDALFCEECGYDFTTGTPPMGSEPEPAAVVGQSESVESVEPQETDVAEDEAEEDVEPDAAAAADAEGDVEPDAAAADEPDKSQRPINPEHTPLTTGPPQRKARHTPPSRALADAWVVEVWIDPDWYAVQQTDEACPSAGVPDIVLLTRSTALIGRPSGSLGVRPDIDAGVDSAVSRRHAQLTSDGRRWWIEDLGSSNGTFVGSVGEPVPTAPIPAGQRVETDRDDRIYVGAWTRLVLRQATESEKAGLG